MILVFFSQVILILTKLYDFHLGSVTESTLWRWAKSFHLFLSLPPLSSHLSSFPVLLHFLSMAKYVSDGERSYVILPEARSSSIHFRNYSISSKNSVNCIFTNLICHIFVDKIFFYIFFGSCIHYSISWKIAKYSLFLTISTFRAEKKLWHWSKP